MNQSLFSERINKIGKSLAKLTKRREKNSMQLEMKK